jgi:hypothetical protein
MNVLLQTVKSNIICTGTKLLRKHYRDLHAVLQETGLFLKARFSSWIQNLRTLNIRRACSVRLAHSSVLPSTEVRHFNETRTEYFRITDWDMKCYQWNLFSVSYRQTMRIAWRNGSSCNLIRACRKCHDWQKKRAKSPGYEFIIN